MWLDTFKAGPKMKCPSSCPLNFDEFPFFKTSVARLEPEIEQFEVRSTFVGFFAIFKVRKEPPCDYTFKAGPKMKWPSSCPLNFGEFSFFKNLCSSFRTWDRAVWSSVNICWISYSSKTKAAVTRPMMMIQQMLTELQTALSRVQNELERFKKKKKFIKI